MTRIVLDGLPLVVRSAGVATYTRELAHHLAAAAPAVHWELFAPPGGGAELGGKERGGPQGLQGREGRPEPAEPFEMVRSWRYPLVMGQPAPWMPAVLSLESAVGDVDLFHGTTYSLPAATRVPLVATVHDLALLRHPELGNRRLRAMVRAAVARLPRARRIIAVSHATRDDLVELCGIAADKIDVIHNGCVSSFAPVDHVAARAELRERLGLHRPFLLHVGTMEPRKNLATLIRAFARARHRGRFEHGLVLAGAPGWGTGADRDSLAVIADRAGVGHAVRFVGNVDAATLRCLYGGADLFVFPSLYEGFGLPVIEAMASGVPVIASASSSLPEVAGDAAALVDPHSEAEMATAIRDCLENAERASSLRAAGLARARAFTWEATARATLETYARCLGREIG